MTAILLRWLSGLTTETPTRKPTGNTRTRPTQPHALPLLMCTTAYISLLNTFASGTLTVALPTIARDLSLPTNRSSSPPPCTRSRSPRPCSPKRNRGPARQQTDFHHGDSLVQHLILAIAITRSTN
ncbi:hypothetical protein F5Y16DRAFT_400926 [Xylariaceae sp. FL0255]|nr:hypothetical protein F5Y16DRAFT_400926 [Xylariaceae sp. FL0255]